MAGYQVKGSTINSKFAFVRSEFGATAEESIGEELESSTGEARPFLDSSWYPFATYVALLRLIARHHFGGDLSKLTAIGAGSARLTFAHTYRAFLTGDDFLSRFRDKPADQELVVVKMGASAPNEILAITGATISSDSVANIVNQAVATYKEPIRQLPVDGK